jgi:histidinol dehydrogenase
VEDWHDKTELVKGVLHDVRTRGDIALTEYTAKWDGWQPTSLKLDTALRNRLATQVAPELVQSLQMAYDNIERFHAAQRQDTMQLEVMPGVVCKRKSVPIQRVGLYIPGGTAPLFSSLLMLGVPAKVAGCKEIVVFTPAVQGEISPVLCKVLQMLDLEEVYLIGGAQAVAAMAYGTESIAKVSKIFGPGNSYVTIAKQLVATDGVAIDLPAGPSEVAVLADHTANAAFIAADLLAQAEHGADSQVLLVTNDRLLPTSVQQAIAEQIMVLPRKEIAHKALNNSRILVFDDMDTAMDFINHYAPEHLILQTEHADELEEKVINAGSVFTGLWTPESVGDYASGTNHTLPTNGYAQAYSGVSLDSFVKKITFQKLTKAGLQGIGPAVEYMAEAEGLAAHKNAVTIRLQHIVANV